MTPEKTEAACSSVPLDPLVGRIAIDGEVHQWRFANGRSDVWTDSTREFCTGKRNDQRFVVRIVHMTPNVELNGLQAALSPVVRTLRNRKWPSTKTIKSIDV